MATTIQAPHGWHWNPNQDGSLLRDRDGARALLTTCRDRQAERDGEPGFSRREPSSLEWCAVQVIGPEGNEPVPADIALALMRTGSLLVGMRF